MTFSFLISQTNISLLHLLTVLILFILRRWFELQNLLYTNVKCFNNETYHPKISFCILNQIELPREPLLTIPINDSAHQKGNDPRLIHYRVWSTDGYIDIGDGCWRRFMLVTDLRCWWRIFNIENSTSIEILSPL